MSDVNHLAKILNIIEKTLLEGKYEAISNKMLDKDPKKLHPLISVGMLRISYPFRKKINHWHDFLAFTRFHLHERGYDTKLILRGLHERV